MPRKSGSPSEYIQHIVAVRYRITGSGNLKTTVFSYDGVTSSVLPNISMLAITDREPTILANFNSQRLQIKFETTEINETFTLTRIIAFVKPVAASYPQ